jgi:D-glycero-D-manno-heptose 1,7-bisphosphate phosphatase
MAENMRAAVFLDRDGVIIENRRDHVKCWAEVRFLDGAFAALARLAASPLAVVIVTNQAVIGRGLIAREAAWRLHRAIVAEIERHGGRVDASYICPHRPEEGCACRKPAAGMIEQAAREWNLDLGNSWLVGDALTDLHAAEAAGLRGILVRTGRGAEEESRLASEGNPRWLVMDDLGCVVRHIASFREKRRA